MRRWYVAKVKPNKVRLLTVSLSRWRVRTYYPYIRVRQGADSDQLEPLFPGYVFCQFDADDPAWQAIRWAPGLSYFLIVDDRLAPVPEAWITGLGERVRQWNGRKRHQDLRPGDQVVIDRGPMRGLSAIFDVSLSADDRCKVLVHTMGSVVGVELPKADVSRHGWTWIKEFATGS